MHGEYVCHFGPGSNAQTLASYESVELLKCVSPKVIEGSVSLLVSYNNVTLHSTLRFDYQQPVLLHQLSPLIGPQDGATLLTFTGASIANSPSMLCRFSFSTYLPMVVAAAKLSDTQVQCITPKAPMRGDYLVEVSQNGQQ